MNLVGLPQVKEWTSGRDEFDLRSFVLSNATVAEACAFSELFWPEFVEYRDCVFLQFLYDEQGIDSWFEKLNGDRSAIESLVNHLHLWDVLAPTSEAEYGALAVLANSMASMWKMVARLKFPTRSFVVSVAAEPDEYDPTLTLKSL